VIDMTETSSTPAATAAAPSAVEPSQAPAPVVTPAPIADLGGAPLPTASTVRARKSLPVQVTRFVAINARIMRMVIKGHH